MVAALAVVSLTACSDIFDIIDNIIDRDSVPSESQSESDASSNSSDSSSSSSSSSSNSSSSQDSQSSSSDSSSVPSGDTLVANKASSNYMDFTKNSAYPLSCTPCVGNAKLLIIPIWFSNSSTYVTSAKKAQVRSDIEKVYFGTNDETGWRSVKSYYEEESLGALTLTGTVSDWYSCGSSYTTYGVDDDVSKTITLLKNATNWYFNNNPSDSRTNYDCDHDGYLDGVMMIYAAPDYGSLKNNNYDNLWAYCFWAQDVSQKKTSNPGVNAFFWASYDFMYGSTNASSRAGSKYGGGDTSHCTLDAHTYIHEMGHMFGLTDYYDYSDNAYDAAGSFSMQDCNVGGHDPYSSFALGWGKAYVPTSTTTINLKPFTSSGEMILLTPSFNNYNSPFDEYLLLEYYTPTGLNQFDTTYQYSGAYPTGSKVAGIRLWHVDARLIYTIDGETIAGFTTNPNISTGLVMHAMSNTYNDGKSQTKDYLSPLGSGYYNYNILQLIRNNTTVDYKPSRDKYAFSSSSLFVSGSTFTMSTYSKQFVNSGKLNSKKDLGFSFTVNSIGSENASITINKL